MPVLLNQLPLLALSAAFCVGWQRAAGRDQKNKVLPSVDKRTFKHGKTRTTFRSSLLRFFLRKFCRHSACPFLGNIRIAYIIGRSASLPSMWIVRLRSLGATMLLILNLAGTCAAEQAPAPGQRVLMLYSDERLLPANIIMDEAIRAAFAVGTKNRVEFYSEFLDVARFPGEEQQQRQRGFFRDKYRERPPDLVIAVSGGALVFLAEHRAELFPGVPIVYYSVTGDPHPDHLLILRF